VYYVVCALVFLAAYLVNTTMISVFYHRGLAHSAVVLSPRSRWFVEHFGIWLTGLDPKSWVCMHRLHHTHSDTDQDPHSPLNWGLWGTFLGQHRSYERILVGLAKGKAEYCDVVSDIAFDIHRLNRMRIWWMPYVVHLAIALAVALPTGYWLLAAGYWLGIMTHPVEGFVVNAFGHAYGERNFHLDDNSRNNLWAAWLILGEGLQNNHHAHPASAKFSFKPHEVDVGWGIVKILDKLGALKINRRTLIHVVEAARAEVTEELPVLRRAA